MKASDIWAVTVPVVQDDPVQRGPNGDQLRRLDGAEVSEWRERWRKTQQQYGADGF